MDKKRKQYLTGSIVLLVISLGSIIGALIASNRSAMHGQGVLAILIGLCSLVAIGTFLTMMVTRGFSKSFADAFKGTEKKCLVGALTIMTAIVMTQGCLSLAHLTGRFDRQTMNNQQMYGYRNDMKNRGDRFGKGHFPSDNNQTQQTPDQNSQSQQSQTPPTMPNDQKTQQTDSNTNTQQTQSSQSETSSAQ